MSAIRNRYYFVSLFDVTDGKSDHVPTGIADHFAPKGVITFEWIR